MANRATQAFPVGGSGGGLVLTGRHGWLYWRLADDLDVRVQVTEVDDDGLAPIAVVVRSTDETRAVTGTDLRRIVLGQLVAALGRDDVAAAVREMWWSRRAPDFRPESCSPRQASLMVATTPIPEAPPSLALRVPKGHKRDDLFYATVQAVYDNQAAISRRAAADLAEANGVPVTTVHRWLKEGRRRRQSPMANPVQVTIEPRRPRRYTVYRQEDDTFHEEESPKDRSPERSDGKS